MSRAGCTKHIAVRTSEACEPKAECIAQNEKMEMLELYPLIPQHGHEIVADVPETNGSIYMNLCGPMEPIRGKNVRFLSILPEFLLMLQNNFMFLKIATCFQKFALVINYRSFKSIF